MTSDTDTKGSTMTTTYNVQAPDGNETSVEAGRVRVQPDGTLTLEADDAGGAPYAGALTAGRLVAAFAPGRWVSVLEAPEQPVETSVPGETEQ